MATYKSKIFLVDKDEDELIALEEAGYVAETVLQELLVSYPDLLPGDQIDPENPRRWLLVAREMGVPGDFDETGRWSLDHLFLDQDGIPTFVECKRVTDTRIRREVVAQMLDYAANGTEYWTMDRLRQDAAETCMRRGKELDQEIGLLTGTDSEEPDIEAFWEKVEFNLHSHRVRLIFVADSTPRELRRLVEFLNEEMTNVEVLAVEVKQFKRLDEVDQKALVPRIVGLTESARSGKPTTVQHKRWTPEKFFKVLQENNELEAYGVAEELYNWSKGVADEVDFGTGTERGSFTFYYLRKGKRVSVFTVYTGGNLMINYGYLINHVDYDIIDDFHQKIVTIPSFEHISADLTKYPSTKLTDAFPHSEELEAFKSAVLWLKGSIPAD